MGPRSLTPVESSKFTIPHKRAIAFFVDGLNKDMDRKPGEALLSYQEALLYDSTSADIYLAIGKDYLLLGKEELGLRSLKTALRLDPESIEAWSFLTELELRKGNIDKAETALNTILELDSLNLLALNQSAIIALQKEKINSAERFVRQLMMLGAKPMPALMMGLGDHYLDNRKTDKGMALFGRLIELDPRDGLGYFGQGMFFEQQGDTAGAVSLYRQALIVMPKFPEAVARLSQIYMSRGDWDAGLELFSEAIAIDSTDIDAFLGKAVMYRGRGEVNAANLILQDASKRFPQDARPSYDLGQFFMQDQRYIDAFQSYKNVTKVLPQNGGGWLNAGLALLFADSVAQSEHYFRKAVEILPGNFQPLFYLGTVLAQLDRNEEAIPYLESSLGNDSNIGGKILAMSTLASVYDATGQFVRADTLFERSLRLAPDNGTILNNYAYSLCERDQRLDDARIMAEKAISIEPDNASFLDTIGWIYFKLEEVEAALQYILQSWTNRPESAEVASHLAEIYQYFEQVDNAVSMWKKALDLDPDNLEIKEKLKQYE
ncbi:tetratricopeptide repeat protein [bacterium]|nr:tetratricopeptide repeat protein [bacterium]